jgi:hypothetical protein
MNLEMGEDLLPRRQKLGLRLVSGDYQLSDASRRTWCSATK